MNVNSIAGFLATIGLPAISISWVVYRDRHSDKAKRHREEDKKIESLTERVTTLEHQVNGFKFYVLRLVGIMETRKIPVPAPPEYLEL